ncbi:MAG: acetate kinase [Gracilibacteraceae bacterium]|jgi:acetate kinase|nr:acetate kinase [Gracilibacteraceae bacterium]
MKILVVNCGSSSLKYQVFEMTAKEVLAKGLVDRIGLTGSSLTHTREGRAKEEIACEAQNHGDAVRIVIGALLHPDYGVVTSLSEIDAVGHRVLHGGQKAIGSMLITDEVKEIIHECFPLGPLHNPANLAGINACERLMPGTPQVAVFDTSFHQTMPPEAYIYGLPYELYEKHGIRRYGFHGTSHKFIALQAPAFLGRKPAEVKLISCHLGNGSSLAAVRCGKCVDTSMGLTPLEGLVMGTRSGDLDPTIVSYIVEKAKIPESKVNDYLNKESGVLGISGVSSDFRDLEKAAADGNARAQLALDIFSYHVKKYIGSYAAAMGGVDIIAFTAGLGENSPPMRRDICRGLEFLGARLDDGRNESTRGKDADISTDDSTCKILVIPTNEELMIAMDTHEIVSR